MFLLCLIEHMHINKYITVYGWVTCIIVFIRNEWTMLGESELLLSSMGPLLVVQYRVVWTQKRHTKIKMCSVGYISIYLYTHTSSIIKEKETSNMKQEVWGQEKAGGRDWIKEKER